MQDIENYLKQTKQEIEKYLDPFFPEHGSPQPLKEAMRYALLNGGKRVRAILTITIGRGLGGQDGNILPYAGALEMIHAYSLVHDDLPAMDNDDYRRGQLTTHKKFGEAMGILTGDALLTHAFWILSLQTKEASLVQPLTQILAWYAGMGGMVAGQVADVLAERQYTAEQILGPQTTPAQLLQYIHENKTMALICAACHGGAIAAHSSEKVLQQIVTYGKKIGLAFQIVDDILDVVGDEKEMGKKVHKDQQLGKLTYPQIWGVEKSREMSDLLITEACQAVSNLPVAGILSDIAHFIVSRTH